MSDHSLPKTVDALKYADQNKVLEGHVAVKLMPRLLEMLEDESGFVQVYLEFDRDEQRLRVLKGRLNATLQMRCERCLKPVAKEIESNFELGIVLSDEDAKQLPRRYEPLLLELDEPLELKEVIEEELILSLPMFAYHEACAGDYEQADNEPAEDAVDKDEGEKENPFSVLSELKLKK